MGNNKTLRTIVTENWDNITRALNLDIGAKPENMLLLLSHLRPYLDVGVAVFPSPSVAVYSTVDKIYEKDLSILEKMNFVSKMYNSYGLTSAGVDLMNCYHKSRNPNFMTAEEIMIKTAATIKEF